MLAIILEFSLLELLRLAVDGLTKEPMPAKRGGTEALAHVSRTSARESDESWCPITPAREHVCPL
jgi:hypothetical protein